MDLHPEFVERPIEERAHGKLKQDTTHVWVLLFQGLSCPMRQVLRSAPQSYDTP